MNEKICKECDINLPINRFYGNRKSPDGYETKCIDCRKIQIYQKRRTDPTYKNRINKYSLESQKRNKKAGAAQKQARYWLKMGLIERKPCAKENDDCGGSLQMHHEDYDKPLEIIWFCEFHHGKRHREININKQLTMEF